jgi:EAL domain-containing protein (putative c-di-GMP-specific phosphodiesterase class I)
LSSLATPVELRGRTMVLAGSMGIALAPDDADDPDQLLRNAETALRRTKGKARGSYRFFQPEMDKRLQDQAELRLSLRDALAHDEFRLVYQPLVNLQSGRVGSFEALIRWQHPLRGLVQPADFIPIAEETGLIVPIGRWALQEACRQAATWPAEISVAVNVSAVQFGAGALGAQIDEALALSGLAPGRLELEVTETLLLQDDDANTRILRALRQRGIRTAMDDFGTGFSSLGYLRRFAFDKIKIDRCLVRDLPDSAGGDAIVHAIIALARSLGIAVTAEGVETQAQLDLLRAQNCAQVQGYLFSRPVPPEAVLELCERSFG